MKVIDSVPQSRRAGISLDSEAARLEHTQFGGRLNSRAQPSEVAVLGGKVTTRTKRREGTTGRSTKYRDLPRSSVTAGWGEPMVDGYQLRNIARVFTLESDVRDLQSSLVIVVASLLCVVAAGRQTQSAAALPEALRTHLKDERFDVVTSLRGLPLGVREALQTLFGAHTLDIAEPGAEFQANDVVRNPALPTRRLVAAGCSADHCLVHYERGGSAHTWHVAIFHWTPQATRFEWGGTAPNDRQDHRRRSKHGPFRKDQGREQPLVTSFDSPERPT